MANGSQENVNKLAGIQWVVTGLALVFLVLRLYCKRTLGKGFWWDDHILIAAWVSTPRVLLLLIADTQLGRCVFWSIAPSLLKRYLTA